MYIAYIKDIKHSSSCHESLKEGRCKHAQEDNIKMNLKEARSLSLWNSFGYHRMGVQPCELTSWS
jgi:hypothetical protein